MDWYGCLGVNQCKFYLLIISEFLFVIVIFCYRMLRVQDKLNKAAYCLEYFTTQEWKFDDKNVRELAMTLNETDKVEFCFDVAKINWDNFIENYILGIRR